MKKIVVLLMILFLSFGCLQTSQPEEQQITFTIKGFDSNNELVFEKQLQTEDSIKAFDALKENNVMMEYEQYSFGVLITRIEAMVPQIGEYIALYVNGDYSNVGVSDLELNDGDVLEFRVEKFDD